MYTVSEQRVRLGAFATNPDDRTQCGVETISAAISINNPPVNALATLFFILPIYKAPNKIIMKGG